MDEKKNGWKTINYHDGPFGLMRELMRGFRPPRPEHLDKVVWVLTVLGPDLAKADGESSGDMETFRDIWKNVFFWALLSSFVVHTSAALIALCKLYRHKYGRLYPILIFLMGFISPLTGGACTSAVITAVFIAARWKMSAIMAMFCGCAQTVLLILVSMNRMLATL